jgi:ABC-type Fe3+/spermidine/putrescine transport system ATPase subunit
MLTLSRLAKRFGDATAVGGVSFTVENGEFLAIVGPSGCGKTTLLRMIAGFESPSEGSISLDGLDMNGVPPERRNIGMVFQHYALFPHMTVAGNIGFGLSVRGIKGSEAQQRIAEAADTVRLTHKLDAPVPDLSGGEQQRVALARAIVIRPSLLLLDEPLSNLDPQLREEMREEIARVQRATGITAVYVTHDQHEALSLADRVLVMRSGVAEHLGTPRDIYFRPRTPFVARFIGNAEIVPVSILAWNRDALIALLNGYEMRVEIPEISSERGAWGLAIKPEAMSISDTGMPGIVEDVSFLGSASEIQVRVAGHLLRARIDATRNVNPGDDVFIVLDPNRCSLVPL